MFVEVLYANLVNSNHEVRNVMSGMFPELEPAAPKPVATTMPLFDTEPGAVQVKDVTWSAAPVPDHRPASDVALFKTALTLPSETTIGPLAFQFTVD
jgi:hypothetical protein